MVAPKNQPGAKMRAMVAQAESGKMQAADDSGKQADAFEEEIAELKVTYDKYFLGLERFEPIKEREDLKARLLKFKSMFIRNTGVRFRVQAQYQKFLSLERMWLRIAKEIEDGTYSRDLFKAKMRGAKRKDKEDVKKKKKGEAFDLSAEESEQSPPDDADAASRTAEPKTDPHLVIPAELRARGTPVSADDLPLVMPAPMAARPPPPPPPAPSSTARTDSLPALVPPAPGAPPRAKPPPPPPMTSPGMAAASPPRSPSLPPTPASAAPGGARVSGAQPAVVPASSKISGPVAAIRPTVSPAASQGLPKVTASASTTGGMRALPPPPPGSTGARPPPPPPPGTGGARPPPPPGAPRPAASGPALGEDKMKAIYSAYLAAKRQCKESTDGITYESVSRTISTQVPELMKQHNAKAVDFKVVIKNGKATLKAVPKV